MEIVNNIYNMWGEFWSTASAYEKALSVMNTVGAIYTFVVTWLLYQKIDDYHKNHTSFKARLANMGLIGIMVGSFFNAIAIHVPDLPQAAMHGGMTLFVTVGYLLVRKYKSQVTDFIE